MARTKGSQLNQLKTQLRDAGVVQTSTGKGSGGRKAGKRKGKHGGGAGDRRDPEARRKRINEITATHNLFDLKSVKPKFAVGGQRRVDDNPTGLRRAGAPAQSRSRAEQLRRETLLPEYLSRHRNSTFIDRRFGENNAGVSAEERALERFVAERKSRLDGGAGGAGEGRKGKRQIFNLDEEDEGLFDQDEGLGGLTHGRVALDLDGDGGDGGSDPRRVDLGGFELRRRDVDLEDEDEGPHERKKSKAEVMSEVIAKSKLHKYERQQRKDEDEEARLELDEELKEIRSLLGGGGVSSAKPPEGSASTKGKAKAADNDEDFEDDESQDDEDEDFAGFGASGSASSGSEESGAEEIPPKEAEEAVPSASGVDRALLARLIGSPSPSTEDRAQSDDAPPANDAVGEDDEYDRFVRELAFEKRAKPADRLKTATERAVEEAERLRKLEEARLKRMRGEALSEDEDGEIDRGPRKKAKTGKGRRAPQADDLDDDYVENEDEAAWDLGEGLRPDGAFAGVWQDDGVDDEGDSEVGDEEDEDEESEGDEEDIDLEELEGSAPSDEEVPAGPTQALVADGTGRSASTVKSKTSGRFELAYTYPCPSSHAELLSVLASAGAAPRDVATVIDRIRVLHHPSLDADNNAKLAVLGGVVLDHIIHLSSASVHSDDSFDAVNALVPHLAALVQAHPQELAMHFASKLVLMQRNLIRGLVAQAARDPQAKVFPGIAELTVLRLIGALWSTSDFSHPVCAPALLLIEQYLAQARVKTLTDLASGIFLSTLVLQYEAMSKRLVPEAINFLANALVLLLPTGPVEQVGIAESFPLQELATSPKRYLFRVPSASNHQPAPLALRTFLGLTNVSSDAAMEKIDLADAALSLVTNLARLYVSLDAFVELFAPLEGILAATDASSVATPLATRLNSTHDGLSKQLRFARQGRRPLRLQHHRAIPIPSLTPAFDDGDPTKRKWDPDSERAEASKLRALLKKERKGAMRELRKDNRFLAIEKAKQQAEADKAYNAKIGRITAGLHEERAEEKKEQRQKDRMKRADKKRSGRR